ncbi:MAG: ATP-binding cassette domain-containing protein [Methylococcaceae bacterium]
MSETTFDKKTILIIAGANGSGKTTLAPFLYQLYDIEESVNPDIIAAGLSLHPETVAFQAGRIALIRIEQLMTKNISFAYETTLASKTLAHIIKKINRDNYHISLHFLALPNVEIAKDRVRLRVRQGGHDIAQSTIERRFKRGLFNFLNYYRFQVDEWVLYDVISEQQQIIAYQENNSINILLNDKWDILNEQT